MKLLVRISGFFLLFEKSLASGYISDIIDLLIGLRLDLNSFILKTKGITNDAKQS